MTNRTTLTASAAHVAQLALLLAALASPALAQAPPIPMPTLVTGTAEPGAAAGTRAGRGADEQEPAEETYDPTAGIDESGRIPKAKLPDDLAHPERWRYAPEGKIKPGNIFERFLVSSFIVPVFFFDEEVGFGGGVAITDIDFRTVRRREFAGIFLSYTTEGQQRYVIAWRRRLYHRDLEGGGVAWEDRSSVSARGGYERTLTRRFYGLGPESEESDETTYTDEVSFGGVGLSLALPEPGSAWVAGVDVRGEHRNLSRGRADDVDDTKDAFPLLFRAGDGHDTLWVTAGLRFDTRDSPRQPYRGVVLGVSADGALLQPNDDVGAVLTTFGSWVVPMPPLFHDGGDPDEQNPPTDTLAIGAQLWWTEGDLPFWALPSLGGRDTLRGFAPNRWTGEAAWHAAIEYRFWFVPRGVPISDAVRIERIGAALFFEMGAVARALHRLEESEAKPSGGFGFRFTLERTALFRFDVGFSEDGANFTFGFGLSF